MLDPKTVAEAMDYIVGLLRSVDLPMPDSGEDEGRDAMKLVRSYTALGRAMGAAEAIRMQCVAESRPKMREVSGE